MWFLYREHNFPEETATVFQFVVVGFLAILVLLFGAITFFIAARAERNRANLTQKKIVLEHLHALADLQENILTSLSMELHDNIGQLLCTAKNLLTAASLQQRMLPEQASVAADTIGKALTDLRSLSRSMHTSWLSTFSLLDNLLMEVQRIRAAYQISITYECNCNNLPMNTKNQAMTFRIIQELLQNSLRHSAATNIMIELGLADKQLIIQVGDNGIGFDQQKMKPAGIGMINIQRRVEILGGVLNWISFPGMGTTAKIAIPAQ